MTTPASIRARLLEAKNGLTQVYWLVPTSQPEARRTIRETCDLLREAAALVPDPAGETPALSWEYLGEELAVFWLSPYGHGKEKIASFWWPCHPPEKTTEVERAFEQIAMRLCGETPAAAEQQIVECGMLICPYEAKLKAAERRLALLEAREGEREKAIREAFAEGWACHDQYPILRHAWEASRTHAALLTEKEQS